MYGSFKAFLDKPHFENERKKKTKSFLKRRTCGLFGVWFKYVRFAFSSLEVGCASKRGECAVPFVSCVDIFYVAT